MSTKDEIMDEMLESHDRVVKLAQAVVDSATVGDLEGLNQAIFDFKMEVKPFARRSRRYVHWSKAAGGSERGIDRSSSALPASKATP